MKKVISSYKHFGKHGKETFGIIRNKKKGVKRRENEFVISGSYTYSESIHFENNLLFMLYSSSLR